MKSDISNLRIQPMRIKILFIIFFFLLAACSPSQGAAYLQPMASSTPVNPVRPSITTQPETDVNGGVNTPTGTYNPVLTPQAAVTPTNDAPALTGSNTPMVENSSTPAATGTTQEIAVSVPDFQHIILIVLENKGYSSVIGNKNAPYLTELAQQNVLMTDYYAVSHPSLPNYIALMSGSTQGITSDCNNCFVNAPNLGDEITASGRTWKAYQESMPTPCYVGNSGLYAQKHDPLIYFDSIRQDTALCQKSIVPMTELSKDLTANQLPNFAFIMPDLCNSGHDCTLNKADTWVNQMVKELQAAPALGDNYLIIITFDEAATSDKSSCCGMPDSAGGRVATILISPLAKPAYEDATPTSHYGLLKTILDAWKLPNLVNTSLPGSQPITTPWQ
jgi:hypothetical protein